LLDGHVTLPFALDALNAMAREQLRCVGALSDAQH
jgi:hypothetical protein